MWDKFIISQRTQMSKRTNDFNAVASIYDTLAKMVFDNSILDAQMEYINRLPNDGRALFIGGGSGKILPTIWEKRPQLQIDYIDASQKMINQAEKRLKKHPNARINFISGTENDIENEAQYDGIITFFFLDLFPEHKKFKIAQKLNAHLKKEGLWLHADFKEADNAFQRIREKSMFLFFKLLSNIEADRITNDLLIFERLNLDKEKERLFQRGGIYSAIFRK